MGEEPDLPHAPVTCWHFVYNVLILIGSGKLGTREAVSETGQETLGRGGLFSSVLRLSNAKKTASHEDRTLLNG